MATIRRRLINVVYIILAVVAMFLLVHWVQMPVTLQVSDSRF